MRLRFLGATETVTGSRTLVEAGGAKILVDCGLFQGFKSFRLKNREPLPVAVSEIDAVILTHAHLDHSGYLPLLVKNGYRGPVYCTAATRDLCGLLLPDSGYLQEEEAKFANKRGFSKHHPALPLYTLKDAEASLDSLVAVDWRKPISIPTRSGSQVVFEMHPAGHLLGAATVVLRHDGRSVAFSGDIGRENDPLLRSPDFTLGADDLVVESTYGDRRHAAVDPKDQLKLVINRTHERGGVLLIPSFAVARAQLVLHYIRELENEGAIPSQPVYLNSPMAAGANQIFLRHARECKLGPESLREACAVAKTVHSVEESKALNEKTGPMIIIAASGMATGGRVLHHLKAFAGDPKNTLLFVGFQAGGTRGDAIVRGETEIKIHGEYWPVRAEVIALESLSAHADRDEILEWVAKLKTKPRRIFVNHGEPAAADHMRHALEEKFGIPVEVPLYGESFDLDVP